METRRRSRSPHVKRMWVKTKGGKSAIAIPLSAFDQDAIVYDLLVEVKKRLTPRLDSVAVDKFVLVKTEQAVGTQEPIGFDIRVLDLEWMGTCEDPLFISYVSPEAQPQASRQSAPVLSHCFQVQPHSSIQQVLLLFVCFFLPGVLWCLSVF